MTPGQLETLAEIRKLLAAAYKDYFARGDGYCKRSEGAVEVHYPRYLEGGGTMEANGLAVYSYVLGPSRMHSWWKGAGPSDHASKWTGDADPFAAALADVRGWHDRQLAWQPDGD